VDAPDGELDAQQWERLKTVVADALEKDEPSERRALIARACHDDPAVLREAEAMLAFSPQRLEAQAETMATALRRTEPNRAEERIGSYRIIRELGRGGMGAVYLAERADDVFEKQVAIKLLKRGTDTDEVLRRFRSEREILARLEHPNIARLIDGGTTDDGLPYFVMEHVVGQPVTDFCSSRALPMEERLQLFLKICGAVQFAHQNLVVHRDLKPPNILVTPDGEPKLLDFGIAKLLAAEDGVMSVTIGDHRRLTPAYASPEQVRGEPVTTASDVYALGALLYELVTGTNAHSFATTPPSATELLRVVGDVAPVRPSAAATDPAAARKLRGDLDNILLQALRKEPARRYATVNGMADDIRCYLGNFPIRARKDTVGYRTSKFVRRNRLAVAAASLVLLALVVGLGVAAWQAQVAATQAAVARAERAKAEQRFNQVRELARSVMFDYYDAIIPLPGSTAVRERIVRDALRYLDSLSQEAGDDASLLAELAAAYWRVASLQGGGVSERSRPTIVSAANLGDSAGALASMGKTIAILERLVREHPAEPAYERELAIAYDGLGGLYLLSGPPEKAVEYIRKSLPRLEALLAKDPASQDLRQYIASGYLGLGKALGSPVNPNVGDIKGAVEAVGKAMAEQERLVAQDPANVSHLQGMGSCHNAMGLLFSALGNKEAELEQNRKGLEIQRRLLAADPGNFNTRRELAVALGNTGSNLRSLNQKPAALPYFDEALEHYEAIVAADPKDVFVRRQWAVANRNVAVAVGGDDPAKALRLFQKATGILAQIVGIDPNNTDFRRQWAFTYMATGRFHNEINEFEQAVANLSEGIRIEEALVRDAPTDVSVQTTMALLFNQLGLTHAKWAGKSDLPKAKVHEHWSDAKDAYGKSLAVYQGLRNNGKLSAADAAKPDELAAEIAKCDAALQAL
jgi:non-specific serine/threonine protein kinase/serine/threonine-protein kinase